jgi:hypothetical protein
MQRVTQQTTKNAWEGYSDEELLSLRFCDLGLKIEDSPLQAEFDRLYHSLRARQLLFKPRFWLSSEWFTPDGVVGIAVPFYLAHARLGSLDKIQMRGILYENKTLTRKILRHEAGHAVQNAYRLRDRADVVEVFGPSSKPYPKYYSPKPYSGKFVRHLGHGYAQSHPDEDFAETFAVWLTPKSCWRKKYAGLPALEKLEFMDKLMHEIAGKTPVIRNTKAVEPLSRLRTTLRTHYRRQRRHFFLEVPKLDTPLSRVFGKHSPTPRTMTAEAFLRKIKEELVVQAAEISGEPVHRVNRVVGDLILRSGNLNLKAAPRSFQSKRGVPLILTRHTVRLLRKGMHKIAV